MYKGWIYLITNKATGMQYVGQTVVGIRARYLRHLGSWKHKEEDSHLHRAMHKYGADNFTVEELKYFTCNTVMERKCLLDMFEVYYIAKYNTFYRGYNHSLGGGGVVGKCASDETKEKMRVARTGKSISQDTREKIRSSLIGIPLSEERKAKISQTKLTKGIPSHRAKKVFVFKDNTLIAEYPNTKIASENLGVSQGYISRVCSKRILFRGMLLTYTNFVL